MMTSGFFALYLMITWVIAENDCESGQCWRAGCFTSNTKSNCATGQFLYCRSGREYCGDAPTSYHVIVTGAIGYYSTWVESGPNDVEMENDKPVYVINERAEIPSKFIWWRDDINTWILNRNVGVSQSISECSESNLFNCPWFDLCVPGNGLSSGYYSPPEVEEYIYYGNVKTKVMYYRSDGDYEFKILYYRSDGSINSIEHKWTLHKFTSDGTDTHARSCAEDIIFDCGWATPYDSDICQK